MSLSFDYFIIALMAVGLVSFIVALLLEQRDGRWPRRGHGRHYFTDSRRTREK